MVIGQCHLNVFNGSSYYQSHLRQSWLMWWIDKISGVGIGRFGRNDGIIPTANQRLRGCKRFGIDLGEIEADHISLTNGWAPWVKSRLEHLHWFCCHDCIKNEQ
jgi:hypothetical protein